MFVFIRFISIVFRLFNILMIKIVVVWFGVIWFFSTVCHFDRWVVVDNYHIHRILSFSAILRDIISLHGAFLHYGLKLCFEFAVLACNCFLHRLQYCDTSLLFDVILQEGYISRMKVAIVTYLSLFWMIVDMFFHLVVWVRDECHWVELSRC